MRFNELIYKILYKTRHIIPNKSLQLQCSDWLFEKLVLPKEKKLRLKCRILTVKQTLDVLSKGDCNISRYRDGEIQYVINNNFKHFFQPYNKKLIDKLVYVLKHPIDNCLIALPNWICKKYPKDSFYYRMLKSTYISFSKLISKDYIYGDALCFNQDLVKNIEYIKSFWNKKDVVIVTGKKSAFILDNRLFNNVKVLTFIYTKAVDAFSEYDKIIKAIRKIHNKNPNAIFLLSLGLTATVLAYDLAKEKIHALDIGHITNYYLEQIGEMPNIEKLRLSGKYVDGVTDVKNI